MANLEMLLTLNVCLNADMTIKKNIQKTMQPSHKTKAPINGLVSK